MRIRPHHVLFDFGLPLTFGALVTLGFAPWNCYPLTLIGLVGMLALWRGAGLLRGAWRGWVFGLAYFGPGLAWSYRDLHGPLGLSMPAAGAGVAGLVVASAVFPAATGALAGGLRRLSPALWALLAVPAAWGASELLRGAAGLGLGWMALGNVSIAAPLDGLAPVVGVLGLSMALTAAAGTLWLLCCAGVGARWFAVALIAAFPVFVWWLPSPAYWTHRAGPPVRVAVIQGGPGAGAGWRPAPLAALARYRDITRRGAAQLVVWPLLSTRATTAEVDALMAPLDREAVRRGQTVVAAIRARQTAASHAAAVPRLMTLGGGSGGRDLDRVPTPLTAVVRDPFAARSYGCRAWALNGTATTVGVTMDTGLPAFGACADKAGVPALWVNPTRDAWFRGSVAPSQHLEATRMRALEMGRPVIRAAAAGTSAVIDFDGRVYERLRPGVVGRLVARVIPRRGVTPFVADGNAPLARAAGATLLLAVIGELLLAWRDRYRRRPEERRRALRARV